MEISPQTVLMRMPPSPAAAGAGEAEESGRGTEDSASCRLITASRSRRPPVGAWEPSPAAFWAGPRSTCFQLVGQHEQRCLAKAPGAEWSISVGNRVLSAGVGGKQSLSPPAAHKERLEPQETHN